MRILYACEAFLRVLRASMMDLVVREEIGRRV